LLATAGAAYVFPLKYEARATILLTAKNIPDEFVPDTTNSNILEQFEAIRGEVFSRDRLSELIVETGLYKKEQEDVTLSLLATRLGRELTVSPIDLRPAQRNAPSSVAFEVTMAGDDPELVATVVNTAVAELIDANVEYRSRQARITTDFMKREFDRADEALGEQQRKLAEFRAENRGALPEEQAASIAKLDRLEDQRRSAILRISDHESRLNSIQARPTALTDSESLETLRARMRNARALYTDDHPTVQSLERQLAAMEASESGDHGTGAEFFEEISMAQKGIELEQMRLAQIDEEVSELEARLALTPKIAEDYDALVREEEILRENYTEYLRKLMDAELALSLESAQQGAQLTRVDTALPPTSPVMSRWLVAAAGTVASFGLSILLGFGREFLFPVIIDEQHLEDAISVPCVGSVYDIA
jgi:uncharacterized protein involved in exopolysaccharide biosynthesis